MPSCQVTGTVKDPTGLPYVGATLSAALNASSSPTVGGAAIEANAGPVTLDANGFFSLGLWGNDQIAPGGSTWQFIIDTAGIPAPDGTGPQSFSVAVAIAGAAQDISGTLNAAAPALRSSGTKPVVSGSKAGNAALASLISALVTLGLITDTTT